MPTSNEELNKGLSAFYIEAKKKFPEMTDEINEALKLIEEKEKKEKE